MGLRFVANRFVCRKAREDFKWASVTIFLNYATDWSRVAALLCVVDPSICRYLIDRLVDQDCSREVEKRLLTFVSGVCKHTGEFRHTVVFLGVPWYVPYAVLLLTLGTP